MAWTQPKLEVLEVGMEIGAYRSPRPRERPRPRPTDGETVAREPERDR